MKQLTLLITSFIIFINNGIFAYNDFLNAIRDDQIDIIKSYVENGIDVNEHQEGYLPISLAASYARFEIVKYLIDAGANPNKTDKWGTKPLGFCARALGNWYASERKTDFLNTIQLLIDYGADVNFTDRNGGVPLYSTVNHKAFDCATVLIKNSADINLVAPLVSKEVIEILMQIQKNCLPLKQNVPLDISLEEFYGCYFKSKERAAGMPLLCYSIQQSHPSIALYLIDKGISNVNECYTYVKTGQSKNSPYLLTPLSLAIEKQYANVITALVKAGANIEQEFRFFRPAPRKRIGNSLNVCYIFRSFYSCYVTTRIWRKS